jgi:hypothetical protein
MYVYKICLDVFFYQGGVKNGPLRSQLSATYIGTYIKYILLYFGLLILHTTNEYYYRHHLHDCINRKWLATKRVRLVLCKTSLLFSRTIAAGWYVQDRSQSYDRNLQLQSCKISEVFFHKIFLTRKITMILCTLVM